MLEKDKIELQNTVNTNQRNVNELEKQIKEVVNKSKMLHRKKQDYESELNDLQATKKIGKRVCG